MIKSTLSAGLILLMLGGGRDASATSGTQGSAFEPDFAAIDKYVLEELDSENVPGASLAIVRGAKIVYARGYGNDGAGQDITPQTPFVIGSMSKAFTAFAVMQLVDQGRIDLDSPAKRYLPEFRVADSAASARITIRQLLNHTSGIPGKAPRGSGDSLSVATHVEALSGVKLNNPPGSKHEYSSPNYLVLGAIIERVTGISFGDYVQANVFTPLGMRKTYLDQDAALRGGLSQGHRYWFGIPRPVTLRHEADRLPTASIISSAADLGNFLIAQLNSGNYAGTSVLSAPSVAQMHQPGIEADGFDYGMGWRISRGGNGAIAVHHGGIVPHFRGKMVMLPAQRWGVVLLTNVSSALPISPASHRIADNIGAYLAGEPLPSPGSRFKLVYLVIAAVVLLLSYNQVRQAMIAWRSRQSQPARNASALTKAALGLLVPIALLIGLPMVIGLPWGQALQSLPDIAYWLIGIASIDIVVRLFSIVTILSSRRRG